MLPALYHAHHSHHLEDIPFWLALATESGGPVLELGCGTGRVLMPLSRLGLACFGIDRDLAMLRFLHECLGQSEHRPGLISADMSKFHMARRFPLVILPCNTFSTLSKSQRHDCLLCVHRHLVRRGLFAVSVPNPVLLANAARLSPAEYEDEFTLPQTGNPVQISSAWQRSGERFSLSWIYDHLLPDGQVERYTIETSQHIYTPEQLTEEFGQADLHVCEIFGDFDRSVYRGDSPHLIVLAEA